MSGGRTLRDVGQHAGDEARRCPQPMRPSGLSIHDMDNVHPKGHQHIGDHSPVAAPPEDLRAHDRGSETQCECQQLEKAGGKLLTDQMVGVTAECRVRPGSVGSIRDGLDACPRPVRHPISAGAWAARSGRDQVSQLNGCAYCVDMHTKDARARGEGEQRLYALPVWHETPFFKDRERAAPAWTEAMTLLPRAPSGR
jgi:AhpD family alkylhydroperoxidase